MRAFACLTKFPRRVLSCVDNQDLVTVVLEKSRLWIVRRRRRPAVLMQLRMRTNVLRPGCPASIEIHPRPWILSLDWIMSESEAVISMINVLEDLQLLVILARSPSHLGVAKMWWESSSALFIWKSIALQIRLSKVSSSHQSACIVSHLCWELQMWFVSNSICEIWITKFPSVWCKRSCGGPPHWRIVPTRCEPMRWVAKLLISHMPYELIFSAIFQAGYVIGLCWQLLGVNQVSQYWNIVTSFLMRSQICFNLWGIVQDIFAAKSRESH